jgi:hypothetical protein
MTSGIFILNAFFLNSVQPQTINATGNGPNVSIYQLNGKSFSSYPTVSGGVDLGNCGPLDFGGSLGLSGSWSAHTLTVSLKNNGGLIQSATATLGPLFIAQDVRFDFSSVVFSPGDWTIEWQFQTANQQSGSQSIKLYAPILAPTYNNLNPDYTFCNRYSSIWPLASYANGRCLYRSTPQSGFIYSNSYYVVATPSTNCALGSFDGANCWVMNKPGSGFIFANRFYKKYDACSKGTNDLAHCYLGPVPSGSQTFVYQGAWYYTYASGANKCPLPGTSDDYANCYVGSTATAFEYSGGLYVNYDSCSTGTNDGANCLLASAPWGTITFEYQGGFYVTPTKTCSIGSFDGANCHIGSPPSGTTAYKQGSNWYWTPRYCN